MKNKFLVVFIIVFLIILGFFYHRYQVPPNIDFPNLELTTISGESVSLQDFSEKPILINFYQSWCGPCLQEMPSLAELSADKDLKVICISDESAEVIQKVADRFPSNILFLKMKGNRKEIGIYTIPTTYLINQKGKKVLEKIGGEDWNSGEMKSELKVLLNR